MTRWLRWLLSLAPRGDARGPRLVILRHHRVYGPDERPLYRLGVGVRVFERQLELLARLGSAPVTVAEGLAWLAGAREGTCVALSFDDGYRDNVTRALPLLERHGARGTFYLTAGLIEDRLAPWWDRLAYRIERAQVTRFDSRFEGRSLKLALGSASERRRAFAEIVPLLRVAPEVQERRLQNLSDALRAPGEAPCELATWDELGSLAARGMEVGAHTLTHPLLTRLSPERQDAEIGGSAAMIRSKLGVECAGFAFPGGDYDARSVQSCARHRMRYAVTTRRGDVRPGTEPFELPRRGLSEGACVGPTGRFSSRMARAELAGAFDGWRRVAEMAS
ncbi:MAG TPA: polysaccharide deacetylase family protein [Candidatus Udaeobacter sp.]|nr:polysaccharide deacetylase family protein [Candidatus Udaeobacter sp.]